MLQPHYLLRLSGSVTYQYYMPPRCMTLHPLEAFLCRLTAHTVPARLQPAAAAARTHETASRATGSTLPCAVRAEGVGGELR